MYVCCVFTTLGRSASCVIGIVKRRIRLISSCAGDACSVANYVFLYSSSAIFMSLLSAHVFLMSCLMVWTVLSACPLLRAYIGLIGVSLCLCKLFVCLTHKLGSII